MALLTLDNPVAQKQTGDDRFFHQTAVEGKATTKFRLLPDPNGNIAIALRRNSIRNNTTKEYYTGFSPASIDLPDPINETWLALYRAGDQRYREFVSSERFICNVLVLKNPNDPSQEGAVKVFEFNKTVWAMIAKAIKPSDEDIEMGEEAKQLFSLENGNDFILARTPKGDFPSFDESRVQPGEPYSIEKLGFNIEEIKQQTTDLTTFMTPEFFDSYETIQSKLYEITGGQFWGKGGNPFDAKSIEQATDESLNTKPQVSDNVEDNVESEVEDKPATKAKPSTKAKSSAKAKPAGDADDLDALLDSI